MAVIRQVSETEYAYEAPDLAAFRDLATKAEAYKLPDGYALQVTLRRNGTPMLWEPFVVLRMDTASQHLTLLQPLVLFEDEGFLRHLIEGMLMDLFRSSWEWREATPPLATLTNGETLTVAQTMRIQES